MINNLEEYINNTRESIDVNLPTDEQVNAMPQIQDMIGESVHETFLINWKWIYRVGRFIGFYGIGICVYSSVEGWDFRTCVYFITQTVSTVGYGNIFPVTTAGQTFTIFFMFTGILLIFSVIGDVTSWLVMYMRKGYTKPIKRSRTAILVRNMINALMWFSVLLLLLLFGATVISLNEGWSFHDAFYFVTVTATSIGYGDKSLSKASSVWFNVFFILLAVSTTALALDKIGNLRRHIVEADLDQKLNNIQLSPELLFAINKQTVCVTRSEYVLHMLQLAGRLDRQRDVDPWVARFNEFDLDRDGVLTMNDVRAFEQIAKRVDLGKISRKRPNKKKSIFVKISQETRDVFLETFKLKEIDKEYGEQDDGGDDVGGEGRGEVDIEAQMQSAFQAIRRRNKSLGHVNSVMIDIGLAATSGADDEDGVDSNMVFSPLNGSRTASANNTASTTPNGDSDNTCHDDDVDDSSTTEISTSTRPFAPRALPVSPATQKRSSILSFSPTVRRSSIHDRAASAAANAAKTMASNRSLQSWSKKVHEQNVAEQVRQQQQQEQEQTESLQSTAGDSIRMEQQQKEEGEGVEMHSLYEATDRRQR
jgi:hypothetical protein